MRKVIAIVLTALWITGVVAFVASSQDDLDKLEHIRSQWSNWPTAQGKITSSETTSGTNPNGEPYYRLNTRFEYEVKETLYYSTQSWYVSGPREEGKYTRGIRVTVHYDPMEPQTAVIEPARIPAGWESAGEVYAPAIVFGILVSLMILANIWPHGTPHKQA
jgi:hypothetical protein